MTFNFDRLKCKDFYASEQVNNGFYLRKDHLGLNVKFNVFCYTRANQSNSNGKQNNPGLLGSAVRLNLTGSYFMTELGFGYDEEKYQIIPILEKLKASFDQVDVLFNFSNIR